MHDSIWRRIASKWCGLRLPLRSSGKVISTLRHDQCPNCLNHRRLEILIEEDMVALSKKGQKVFARCTHCLAVSLVNAEEFELEQSNPDPQLGFGPHNDTVPPQKTMHTELEDPSKEIIP